MFTTLKQSYLYLVLGILSAILAGWWAMHDPGAVAFCQSTAGWVFMLVVINVTPYIALWAAKQSDGLGIATLALDGALSGVALCPLLHYADMKAPGTIPLAGAVTAVVWATVSAFVFLGPRQGFLPRGTSFGGIGMVLLGTILLNGIVFHLGWLSVVLTIGVGIYGVVTLVLTTEEILHNRVDSGVKGALMLFASLFNIFAAALRLLLILKDED